MAETIILSIAAFAGTNIDDILINTLLYAEAKNAEEQRHIVLGKYLGIGALVLLSLLGAYGLHFLPERLIECLGLLPIALGVKELLEVSDGEGGAKAAEQSVGMALRTALITVANGADNIGVYVPLFAAFSAQQILLAVCVFAALIYLWCLLGRRIAGQPAVQRTIAVNKKRIVPTVYIALGLYILMKNAL